MEIINVGKSGYALLERNCQHLAEKLWKLAIGQLSLQEALDSFVGKYN